MADRDLNHLCEPLRIIYRQWQDQCETAGLNVKAIVTWRSALDQDLAKQQGLSNAAAGQSPHNICDADGNPNSYAFDFACFDLMGNYITNGSDHRYQQAAEIGKTLGLVWGGDWMHPDWDHLEMADWKEVKSQTI